MCVYWDKYEDYLAVGRPAVWEEAAEFIILILEISHKNWNRLCNTSSIGAEKWDLTLTTNIFYHNTYKVSVTPHKT